MAKDRTIAMITAANPLAPGKEVNNPNIVKVVCDRASDALYFSRSAIPWSGGFPAAANGIRRLESRRS
jgi:3-deoxy-manno-octulosonate cytidylyltransferase (CMP-KDO synthetase)